MPKISYNVLVPYGADQIYQLLIDVQSYPQFLPWCIKSYVIESSPMQMIVSMEISKSGIKKTLTTCNTMIKNRSIEILLVDGPFKKLIGSWKFIPINAGSCYVRFYLDFEFLNKVIELVFSYSFKELAFNIVQVFITRAKEIYNLNRITVEVVYALPEKQYLQQVTLKNGATVEQAIIASNMLKLCGDINLNQNKVGIYSRLVTLSDLVKDGDRVEIYRPLIINPRELRRQKAKIRKIK